MTILSLFISLLFLLPGTLAHRLPLKQDAAQAVMLTNEVTAPQYPGGEEALFKFLAQTIRYPSRAQLTKTVGRVIMQVTMNEEGKLGNMKAAYTDSPLFEKEAIRVLQKMSRWEPAKQNGAAVSSTYLFPLSFNMKSAEGNYKPIPKHNLSEVSEKILADAPNQPLFVSEEVTVTGYGVAR